MAIAELEPAPIRFLAMCRTSTDDQQNPDDSKRWQLARCKALVEPRGGVIVEVIHDIAFSRSVPWMRRPEALALLERLQLPAHVRGFDAVVVAEPQRAWGDSAQVIDVLRKMDHYDVPMWAPEVGGPIELRNEAHMMSMGMYGVMSESERRRIGIRVRNAQEAHVSTGARMWMGARAPYGYRLVATDQLHPNPSKARDGVRLKRLEIDPPTAAVVREIFDRYADGDSVHSIVKWLNGEGIPSPLAAAGYRTPRPDVSGLWSSSTIQSILRNPTYTGYLVYARERGRERLLDVTNTTLGYTKTYTSNPKDEWVWSPEPTHEAIIDSAVWASVEGRRDTPSRRAPNPSDHPYVLRGVVVCGWCGHPMQGAFQRGYPYMRCLLTPYASTLPECEGHPKTAYLREDRVVPGLVALIERLLTDPDHAARTVKAMAKAAAKRTGVDAITAAAQRHVTEGRQQVEQFRRTLEAGGDPVVIGQWINDAMAKVRAAEAELAALDVHGRPLTEAEVSALVVKLAPKVRKRLTSAEAGQPLNRFLRDYGVRIEWRPGSDEATVTVAPPDSLSSRMADTVRRRCARTP